MILLYGYAGDIIGKSCEADQKSAESDAGRMLLARLLEENGIEARLDNIKRKENGKPYLEGCPEIDFSITHSKGFVACVLSLGEGRVGIDAEPSETAYTKDKQRALAKRFFSESEIEALDCGEKSFSELWTRREAYLKMTGEGFAAGIGKELEGVHAAAFCLCGYTVAVAAESGAEIELKAYNK